MSFGYDATLGFVPATYEALLDQAKADYIGETTENADAENGPAADMLRTMCRLLKRAYDDQAGVYNAGFIDGAPGTGGVAEGSSLELLLKPKIGPKLDAVASTITLTLAGTPTTVIPSGSAVVIAGETTTWTLDSNAVIGGGGTVSGSFTYSETGPKTAIAASTWTITTPVAGWTGATNAAAATPGRNRETDAEYRQRYKDSASDNVVAAVKKVAGVTSAKLIENATDTPDAYWGLARWIEVLVEGGDNTAIAQAIQSARAKSVTTVGGVSVALTDSSYASGSVTVKFSRPTQITVHVQVTITKGEDYPADTSTDAVTARENAIKAAVVAYGSRLVSGQDVSSYQIGVAVGGAGIPGIASVQVLVGTVDPPATNGVLAIALREIAVITTANVDVVGA